MIIMQNILWKSFLVMTVLGLAAIQSGLATSAIIEQVHLSLGENESEMIVTWVTLNTEYKDLYVEYGRDVHNRDLVAQPEVSKFKDYIYTYRAELVNLEPGFRYFYQILGSIVVPSKVFELWAFRADDKWFPTFAIYGDVGLTNDQSLPFLGIDVINDKFDAIFHVGDFAYDLQERNGQQGNDFMNSIQHIASRVPYMTCPGNHERHENFTHYDSRFSMVNAKSLNLKEPPVRTNNNEIVVTKKVISAKIVVKRETETTDDIDTSLENKEESYDNLPTQIIPKFRSIVELVKNKIRNNLETILPLNLKNVAEKTDDNEYIHEWKHYTEINDEDNSSFLGSLMDLIYEEPDDGVYVELGPENRASLNFETYGLKDRGYINFGNHNNKNNNEVTIRPQNLGMTPESSPKKDEFHLSSSQYPSNNQIVDELMRELMNDPRFHGHNPEEARHLIESQISKSMESVKSSLENYLNYQDHHHGGSLINQPNTLNDPDHLNPRNMESDPIGEHSSGKETKFQGDYGYDYENYPPPNNDNDDGQKINVPDPNQNEQSNVPYSYQQNNIPNPDPNTQNNVQYLDPNAQSNVPYSYPQNSIPNPDPNLQNSILNPDPNTQNNLQYQNPITQNNILNPDPNQQNNVPYSHPQNSIQNPDPNTQNNLQYQNPITQNNILNPDTNQQNNVPYSYPQNNILNPDPNSQNNVPYQYPNPQNNILNPDSNQQNNVPYQYPNPQNNIPNSVPNQQNIVPYQYPNPQNNIPNSVSNTQNNFQYQYPNPQNNIPNSVPNQQNIVPYQYPNPQNNIPNSVSNIQNNFQYQYPNPQNNILYPDPNQYPQYPQTINDPTTNYYQYQQQQYPDTTNIQYQNQNRPIRSVETGNIVNDNANSSKVRKIFTRSSEYYYDYTPEEPEPEPSDTPDEQISYPENQQINDPYYTYDTVENPYDNSKIDNPENGNRDSDSSSDYISDRSNQEENSNQEIPNPEYEYEQQNSYDYDTTSINDVAPISDRKANIHSDTPGDPVHPIMPNPVKPHSNTEPNDSEKHKKPHDTEKHKHNEPHDSEKHKHEDPEKHKPHDSEKHKHHKDSHNSKKHKLKNHKTHDPKKTEKKKSPLKERINNFFYSVEVGPAHVIMFTTEFYFYTKYGWDQIRKQYNFLELDLQEANKNRERHPWIIVMAHRSLYCLTKGDRKSCDHSRQERPDIRKGIHWKGSEKKDHDHKHKHHNGHYQYRYKRSHHKRHHNRHHGGHHGSHHKKRHHGGHGKREYGLEELFYKYGVDLQFYGHEHFYVRMMPLYNFEVKITNSSNPYDNPSGPIPIITGSGGCREQHPKFNTIPDWVGFHSSDYGYTRLRFVDRLHIEMQQISDNQNGKVIDTIQISKNKPKPNWMKEPDEEKRPPRHHHQHHTINGDNGDNIDIDIDVHVQENEQ